MTKKDKEKLRKRINRLVSRYPTLAAAAADLRVTVPTLWRWTKGHNAPNSTLTLSRIDELEKTR